MSDNIEQKKEVNVEVIDFGPLKITGNFILKDIQRNKEDSPGEVWLCRCGNSKNKPYCDGSHKE